MNNLSVWLTQNPNCEPVKPGSSQANQLMSSISNKKQSTTSLQAPTISSTTPTTKTQEPLEDLFSNPVKINTGTAPGTPTTPPITSSNKKLSIKPKTLTTPSVSKASPNVSSSTKTIKVEEKKIKRQVSDERRPQGPTSAKAKVELERKNVRINFQTTLANRMKDFEHPKIPKMNEEEIEKFAKEMEYEMFKHFNMDTRDKYKNKFRSLKFNLSDVKNKTLLEKICTKTLTPRQLVTLPPSELASEELAKWREDEEKHQLEIITKSELDAMSQNKIIVKTRKGEEIIETSKSTTADIVVPMVGEEDVESMISKTVLSLEDSHGK